MPIPLKGVVQNYAWGKMGEDSLVAKLVAKNDSKVKIDRNRPYAELWMGTHTKGPTVLASNNKKLSEFLSENPGKIATGQEKVDEDNYQLPFLFKVLSVNEPLSIQVHPNKIQAKELHSKDPRNYPDDNHKPEMAIALTKFELLCGFKPPSEILQALESYEMLQFLVGKDNYEEFKELLRLDMKNPNPDKQAQLLNMLRCCFASLMRQHPEDIRAGCIVFSHHQQEGTLFHKLHSKYPNDVGAIAGAFFLNHFFLRPGEAVFLGPNEPHAYLSGDCIECMACSDNTIRAGLTPKFKDIPTLVKSLTYRMADIEAQMFTPIVSKDKILSHYNAPVEEFCVDKIELKVKDGGGDKVTYSLEPLEMCSIMIVIYGSGTLISKDWQSDQDESTKFHQGNIFLVSAEEEISFEVEEYTLVFRAY